MIEVVEVCLCGIATMKIAVNTLVGQRKFPQCLARASWCQARRYCREDGSLWATDCAQGGTPILIHGLSHVENIHNMTTSDTAEAGLDKTVVRMGDGLCLRGHFAVDSHRIMSL